MVGSLPWRSWIIGDGMLEEDKWSLPCGFFGGSGSGSGGGGGGGVGKMR